MAFIAQAIAGIHDPYGFQTLSVSNAVVSFSNAHVFAVGKVGIDSKAERAYMTVQTNSIRVRWDGGTPTQGNGHLLASGDAIEILGPKAIQQFKMIAEGSAAVVFITYEK